MPAMRLRVAAMALCFVTLPALVLLPVWRLGGLGANEDDILYYYPSRFFFHESIRAGVIPQINPLTGLGRPFLADPQSAAWYPSTWLFAVLEPAWAYPASLWLHYSLAAYFMYRLLRSMGLGRGASTFGGAAFAFSGFMLAHRAHFAMQHAAAWTPCVLWRIRRYAETGSGARLAEASLAAAMQALAGHTQIAALTGLGSLVFVAAGARGTAPRRAPFMRTSVRRWATCWLAAAGLFAVQWMPTLAYARICTRTANNYWDFTQNSWSPASAATLVTPMVLGQRSPNHFDQAWWGPSHQCEQFAYAGILPLLLAAMTVRCETRGEPRRRPFVLLGVFALLLSLGKYGPVCPLLYWLPGANLFRVPARGLVLVNLSIAALAAFGLEDLLGRLSVDAVRLRAIARAWLRRAVWIGAGAIAIPAAGVAMAALIAEEPTQTAARVVLNFTRPEWWSPAAMIAASLTVLAGYARFTGREKSAGPAIVMLLIDLSVVGWSLDVPRGATFADLTSPQGAARRLSEGGSTGGRLWTVTDTKGIYGSPLAAAAANTNVLARISSLTDYGPLQPRHYFDRFGFAPWGAKDDPRGLLVETAWTEAMNVNWILLCPPFHSNVPAACTEVARFDGGGILFERTERGRAAWLEGRNEALRIGEQSPDRVVVDLSDLSDDARGSRIVLSQIWLPGWRARADDLELEVERAEDVLMAARLPASGKRPESITWEYNTPGLLPGAALCCATALTLAIVLMANAWRRISTTQR